MSTLADACPACFPGDAPAALPAGVRAGEGGAITADYQCGLCGLEWATQWNMSAAFPESRSFRPPPPLEEVIRLLAVLLEGEELEAT